MSDETRRTILLYGALALLIAGTTYNALNNHDTMHGHEAFFQDVRDFMNAGDRNTGAEGRKRDMRLDRLEAALGGHFEHHYKMENYDDAAINADETRGKVIYFDAGVQK